MNWVTSTVLFLLSAPAFAAVQGALQFNEVLPHVNDNNSMLWTAPDYSGQEKTLGYGPGVFAVPTGMESRVNFWIDIYSKYSSSQGVLHDSQYVNVIYEAVDFNDIMNNKELTPTQKQRARENRVKEAKEKIRDRLARLQKLSSPAGLDEEDLRYWYMFNDITEKDKFTAAAVDGRLRFQLGQSDRIMQGIYESGQYLRRMEAIFKEEGLPIELTRLVFVESSFNLRARSRVGASGIWQFMRSTAKLYLKVDNIIDDRNDPLAATRGAARKLRDNYRLLGAWPLAVTGYNHGPTGVKRLVEAAGTRDIAELTDVRKGRFRFASASFYASFLAALEVEKNAHLYFGPVRTSHPLAFHEIKLARHLDSGKLLTWFEDKDQAQSYNPHILGQFWKGRGVLNAGHRIRVPLAKQAEVSQDLSRYEVAKATLKAGSEHEVQRGEVLALIARKYRVSLQRLMEYNGLENPRALRAGQVLQIPTPN